MNKAGILFFFISWFLGAQSIRIDKYYRVKDSVDLEFIVQSWDVDTITIAGKHYVIPKMKGFSSYVGLNLPAMPSYHPLLVWNEDSLAFRVIMSEDTFFYGEAHMVTTLTDESGNIVRISNLPWFNYHDDSIFPNRFCFVERHVRSFGQTLYQLAFFPFQYKGREKKWIFHKKWTIRLPETKIKVSDFATYHVLSRHVLNAEQVVLSSTSFHEGYLIITTPQFAVAADSLARWKTALGYYVRVAVKPTWSPPQLKDTIRKYYFTRDANLKFVVMLGDHELVPSQYVVEANGFFFTDFPYTLLEGEDYFPEVFIGRIPASSLQEALNMVSKVIRYEKNPPLSSAFYNKTLLVAQFQDDNNDTYEDRRFSQTIEEIATYLSGLGRTVERAYYADYSDNPTYWNNDYYSAGEPIPAYLLKPTFSWNANFFNIRNAINNGVTFVFYRGHGDEQGWSKPSFTTSHLPMLNNNLLPLFFSINCSSGSFWVNDCFGEELIKMPAKGAIGFFSHVAPSYSGYNDALILGMVDAMFPQPGLVPVFTGSAAQPGTINQHPLLYRSGEIALQGLLRMTQTWGNLWNLERRMFHSLVYLGDPAMRLYLSPPQSLQMQVFPVITCQDTSLQVLSLSEDSVMVVVSQEGKLLGKKLITQFSGTVSLRDILPGKPLIVTAIKFSFIPLQQHVTVWGNCFQPAIQRNGMACVSSPMSFSGNVNYPFAHWQWQFGSDAIPSSAQGTGPHEVRFIAPGLHVVQATVVTANQSFLLTDTIMIEAYCPILLQGHSKRVYQCEGEALTNLESTDYFPFEEDTLEIISPGAFSFQLIASHFDVAQGDTLFVFGGTGSSMNLMDAFHMTHPLTSMSIPGDRFTLVWKTDATGVASGIRFNWVCQTAALPPVAGARINFDPCSGSIFLQDTSLHQPTTRTWLISDGSVYSKPSLQHFFADTGTYMVVLHVANAYGMDSLLLGPFVVSSTDEPAVADVAICQPDTVTLSSHETMVWSYLLSPDEPVAVDSVFRIKVNTSQKILAQLLKPRHLFLVGKSDTTGWGSFYNTFSEQKLFFAVHQLLFVDSMEVYSLSNQQATFRLVNPANEVLWQGSFLLSPGRNVLPIKTWLLPASPYAWVISPNVVLYKNYFPSSFYPCQYGHLITLLGTNSSNGGLFDYPGIYRWQVRDACLSQADTVSIEVSFPNESGTYAYYFCRGDTVTLYSAEEYQTTWFPGAITAPTLTITNSGQYYAVWQQGSCTAQSSVWTMQFLPSPDEIQILYHRDGMTFYFSPSETGLLYFWDFGDGYTSQEENPVHTYQDSTLRIVTLKVLTPCGLGSVDTVLFKPNIPTVSAFQENDVIIYPQPTSGIIHINSDIGITHFEVYSLEGKHLATVELRGNRRTFVIDLPSGIYIFKFYTATHGALHKKVIVQR